MPYCGVHYLKFAFLQHCLSVFLLISSHLILNLLGLIPPPLAGGASCLHMGLWERNFRTRMEPPLPGLSNVCQVPMEHGGRTVVDESLSALLSFRLYLFAHLVKDAHPHFLASWPYGCFGCALRLPCLQETGSEPLAHCPRTAHVAAHTLCSGNDKSSNSFPPVASLPQTDYGRYFFCGVGIGLAVSGSP